MENHISKGEILVVKEGHARLVYLGDGVCNSERFIPERSSFNGALTNSGLGKWETSKASITMSQEQIDSWIARRNGGTK